MSRTMQKRPHEDHITFSQASYMYNMTHKYAHSVIHAELHVRAGKGRSGVTFSKEKRLRPESTEGFWNPNNPGPSQYKYVLVMYADCVVYERLSGLRVCVMLAFL